jgi:hypothetical protein
LEFQTKSLIKSLTGNDDFQIKAMGGPTVWLPIFIHAVIVHF